MSLTRVNNITSNLTVDGTLTTTSTGTSLTSNSYNVVKIQTDKDDNGSNDDGILQFTNGSSNTVKGEIRYDESEAMFEIGHGDNQGHLRIDASGRVTKPSQPSFGAYQASANYTAGSGYGKMIADGTRWNEGNHYSTANSRFTAPIAGVYHFSAHVNCYSIADDHLFGIQIYVNGSTHTFGNRLWSRGANDMVVSMSHTIKLDAADYVEVYWYSNDASHGFSSGATWNTFSGFLVG